MRISRTFLGSMASFILLTVMLTTVKPARSASNMTSNRQAIIRVGFSAKMFPVGDQKDARLAMQL